MTTEDVLRYAVVFLVGFLITYLVTPYCRKLAFALNIIDVPEQRRIHRHATPRNGGIAIFIGFHAACASIFLLPWAGETASIDYSWWLRIGIVSAGIFALGLIDDIKGFSPVIKLAGQFIIAALTFFLGMNMGSVLGFDLPMLWDFCLTVLWLLAIMNAFNLIDGLDGLAAGLALIAAVGVGCALLLQGNSSDALVLLALAGTCLAFLRFNFHPASIFLGDAGSLLLGFLIAVLTLTTSSKTTAVLALGVPLFAVGVPLFDTLLAIWRRSIRGLLYKKQGEGKAKGMMQADAQHIHHRLLQTGLRQHQAAIILYGMNIALVFIAVITLLYHSSATGIFVLSFVAGAYVITRHLARLELWQTGRLILEGLKRPPKRGVPALLYPVFDVAILGIGLTCSLLIFKATGRTVPLTTAFQLLVPLWISIPFILLVISGMYRRVWSRARLNDFFKLACVLGAGLLLSSGMTSLATETLAGKELILLTLFEFLIIIPGIFFNRVSMRLVLELVTMCDRRHLWPSECARVMIYGAGNKAMSLLKEMSDPEHTWFEHTHVIGFLDDDPNLWGRFVYGYKVHGGLQCLSSITARQQVDKLILTAPISAEKQSELLRLSKQHGFEVTRWITEEQPLQERPAHEPSEHPVTGIEQSRE